MSKVICCPRKNRHAHQFLENLAHGWMDWIFDFRREYFRC